MVVSRPPSKRDPINKMEQYVENGIQKWRPKAEPDPPPKRRRKPRPRAPKPVKPAKAPE